jgi:DNA-binding GntR family transcriptional regulator
MRRSVITRPRYGRRRKEGEKVTDDQIPLRTVSTPVATAEVLREMILNRRVEPGEHLREAEFAERLGVARHSFRAGTQILISEGLLRRTPNRGVQVPIMGPDDIVDICRLRTALEVEAVRRVIEDGPPLDEAVAAVAQLDALGDAASWRSVVEADMRFHRGIMDATGSERMIRAYKALQSEVELLMVQLEPHYDRPAEVAREHDELLARVIEGQAARAERAFRKHISDATKNLTSAFATSAESQTAIGAHR